jgi:uncharacterized OsmC-like protein
MVGTFGGALEARQIDASQGRLVAEVHGDIEVEDGVLVIRRIHVALTLKAPDSARAVVERVHAVYAERCPVYRSLKNSIEITSSVEIAPA